ncbi:MAG: helix-turn-helix domain-containing protein [Maribacter sp.]|uniref:helix-turn-helix domain-containing protein n=1 Tax=Maribacter sp. TaxID=1897614 RepID=UPI0032996C6F
MEKNLRQFTGVFIPKVIYLNTDMKWPAKILAVEIHSFTANGKECYMSNEYMAKFLQISERQVSRYLTQLKEIGWIEEYGFDGRKRYLRSCMIINFTTGEAAMTQASIQPRQKCLGSNDENVQHIKPIIKQDYSLKEKLNTSKSNRSPLK